MNIINSRTVNATAEVRMNMDEEGLDRLIEQIRKTREIIRERDEYRYTSEELVEINNELQKQMEVLQSQNETFKIGLEEKEMLLEENELLRQQVDGFEFLITTPDYMNKKTISDEFRASVESAKKEIWIVSPWITHLIPEIEEIAPKGVKFKIITRIDKKDIGTQSFDENIARRLISLGRGSIKKLNSLHAKMVIVDGKKAIISSANITRAGLGDDDAEIVNYEAGVVVQGKYVKDAITFFDAMWDKAEAIDDNTLNSIIKEANNEQHSHRG
jgi:phosphatidylserine/phosphatidylglycerophosphate/cardiolipin synthase-like enzyme